MKVTVVKKDFLNALLIGGSFAGRAKALPILDCVKIKFKRDCINIISSDSENAISKRADFHTSDFEGDICVSYKSLIQYVKLLTGEFIEFVISDDLKSMEIKHKKGSMSLPLMNADDFPVISSKEECVEVEMSSATLHNWIVDGREFTVDDMLRPVMNGIYLYRRDNKLGCCASDGHKMFYDHIKDENPQNFEFIINKNSFSSICSICKECDNVKIKIGKANTTFIGDGVTLIIRNIEGRFPNFKSVISNNNDINLILDKNELKEAILRCGIGASQATSLIKLEVKGATLTLSAEDIDFSVKSVETMFVECNGDITIGFKANFLLNILNTISTEQCLIKLKDETRAGIFYEYAHEEIASNKLSLLMPMVLN